ncbi:MAG: TVP38/TMEM64 family protein, partial [Rhizobiales bacterium]|nr:TVP38/TMEM64 family protein [Hyphomicrobiales bacterium]
RLMPFISFDIVSYAAGLTRLTLWRFALATLAGIVPASFLLAHFGSELVSEEPKQIMIAVLAIGLIASLPLLVRSFSSRNQD